MLKIIKALGCLKANVLGGDRASFRGQKGASAGKI